jgi:hypothetical protein
MKAAIVVANPIAVDAVAVVTGATIAAAATANSSVQVQKVRARIKAAPNSKAKAANNAVTTKAIAAAVAVIIAVAVVVTAVITVVVINAQIAAVLPVKPCQSPLGCAHFEASVSTDAFFISRARAPCLILRNQTHLVHG